VLLQADGAEVDAPPPLPCRSSLWYKSDAHLSPAPYKSDAHLFPAPREQVAHLSWGSRGGFVRRLRRRIFTHCYSGRSLPPPSLNFPLCITLRAPHLFCTRLHGSATR
jgi:hypothetical protein